MSRFQKMKVQQPIIEFLKLVQYVIATTVPVPGTVRTQGLIYVDYFLLVSIIWIRHMEIDKC
jgi:hypothetical protein